MQDNDHEVGVFIMGGTIDSRNVPERDGEAVVLAVSLVEKYLKSLPLNFKPIIRVICMKDSRSITNKDREDLKAQILRLDLKYNLVTHGTYTMKQTGEYLLAQSDLKDKVIGITGSMFTLIGTIDNEGRLMPSDGQFNLGYSFAKLPHLNPGVHQLMAGEAFTFPDEWWIHDAEGTSWKKNDKVTTHKS